MNLTVINRFFYGKLSILTTIDLYGQLSISIGHWLTIWWMVKSLAVWPISHWVFGWLSSPEIDIFTENYRFWRGLISTDNYRFLMVIGWLLGWLSSQEIDIFTGGDWFHWNSCRFLHGDYSNFIWTFTTSVDRLWRSVIDFNRDWRDLTWSWWRVYDF